MTWRPKWYDAIPTLAVGVFGMVGPEGWPRQVAVGLVTFLAAAAMYLRYLEGRGVAPPDNPPDGVAPAGKEYDTIVHDDIKLPLLGSNQDSPDPESDATGHRGG